MPRKKPVDNPTTHVPERSPEQDVVAHLVPLGRADNRNVNSFVLEGILEQLRREERPTVRLKRSTPAKPADSPTTQVPERPPAQDLVTHLLPLGRADNRNVNSLVVEGILEQLHREEARPARHLKGSPRSRGRRRASK